MAIAELSTLAVVVKAPGQLALSRLALSPSTEDDVVVDIDFSGISTGTEKLLCSGAMPPFPGMGYPLVPGYESVGRITHAGSRSNRHVGEHVFVPGARCFGEVRGLFGGAAARVVVPGARVLPIPADIGERGVLLALAATARHAMGSSVPDLIVGHGVLGRLVARLCVIAGGRPTVWEHNPARTLGAIGYEVTTQQGDTRSDYSTICDVSGDAGLLDTLVSRLRPSGEIVLAGFYSAPIAFAFPPAFMREARVRIAAQWQQNDLMSVRRLVESSELSLEDIITHHCKADDAPFAYRTAFEDPACLKMILDWRACA